MSLLVLMAPTVFAADGSGAIDTGDTAWVLISAALVFIMTPGLGFFYGGMVRSKNVLTTIMQSFFIVAMISVEWFILGYAMTFGTDIHGCIGSLDKIGLTGVGLEVIEGGTIPELAFVAFQCMFAVITPALITGAFAERIKFRAFCIFYLTLGYLTLQSYGTLGMGRRLPGTVRCPRFCWRPRHPYFVWCIRAHLMPARRQTPWLGSVSYYSA